MIFLILALIWAAALLPPILRARLASNPVDSVGKFRRHLRVLESSAPAASSLANDANPERRSSMPVAWAHEAHRLRTRRRRQQVFNSLIALMGSTLVIGLIPNLHWVLAFHIVADIAFVAYARSLVRLRTRRPIRPVEQVEEDAALLQMPSANSQAL